MTSRLQLYNAALLELGERALASLTENREPRRLLDQVWANGAVDFLLGAGQWKFAKKSVELAPETSYTPAFGYQKAYELPADFIRTTAVCSDEYFGTPLLRYSTERGFIFADVEPLYLSYISNDAAYGGNLALWPADFTAYATAYFAGKIASKLTQDKEEWKRLFALQKKCKADALSSDAMESPTTFPPRGSWVSARLGRSGGGGSRNSLIG